MLTAVNPVALDVFANCLPPRLQCPLPPDHRFPMPKFRLLQELLLREGVIRPQQVHHPELPPLAWIESVHTPEYVRAYCEGSLEAK